MRLLVVIVIRFFVVFATKLDVLSARPRGLRTSRDACGVLEDAADAGLGEELEDLLLGYCEASRVSDDGL